MQRCKGFTLIEMMVVVAILSVVMLLVLPRLPSSDASNLRTSARSLAATIRYLGENSVTGRIPYRLHLNIADSAVTIARKTADGSEAPPDDIFLNKRILNDGIEIEAIQTPRMGTVKEGEVLVDFGTAGLTEFISIHLRASGGGQFTVTAFPGNGKVRVYEGYQEVEL